jgi:hypothetical protein
MVKTHTGPRRACGVLFVQQHRNMGQHRMGWALWFGIHRNDDYTEHILQLPLPHSVFGSIVEALADTIYCNLGHHERTRG